ncbi:MAG: hypothetical protein KatS3mg105_4777 [Gemmatales bacterium]|nr:MAG: hypothetical protein KatS3mg105_4777 [Gemmatales bacterium]
MRHPKTAPDEPTTGKPSVISEVVAQPNPIESETATVSDMKMPSAAQAEGEPEKASSGSKLPTSHVTNLKGLPTATFLPQDASDSTLKTVVTPITAKQTSPSSSIGNEAVEFSAARSLSLPEEMPNQINEKEPDEIDREEEAFRSAAGSIRRSRATRQREPVKTWIEKYQPKKNEQRSWLVYFAAAMVFLCGTVAATAIRYRWDRAVYHWFTKERIVELDKIEAFVRDGRFSEALAKVSDANLEDEKKTQWRERIVQAWQRQIEKDFEIGNYEQARRQARKLLSAFPDDIAANAFVAAANLMLGTTGDPAETDTLIQQAKVDQATRDKLRRRLLDAWLTRARANLLSRRQFAAAEKDADEILARFPNNAEAVKLRRQAQMATQFDKLTQDRNFAEAADLLKAIKAEGDATFHTALVNHLVDSWIQHLESLERQGDHRAVVESSKEALSRLGTEQKILSLYQRVKARLLKMAWQKFRKREYDKALKAAEEIKDLYGSHEAPDAFLIAGRIHEMKGDAQTAFANYFAGLPEGSKARPDQMALLLAKIRWHIDPKPAWDEYRHTLGMHEASIIEKAVLKSAEHAVAMVQRGEVPQAFAPEAHAVAGLAYCFALEKLRDQLDPETVNRYRDKAISFLSLATAMTSGAPDRWLWNYELAQQLRLRMIGKKDVQKDRSAAINALERAKKLAPAVEQKRIDDLLDELKKRSP